jgi:hypothetical protein
MPTPIDMKHSIVCDTEYDHDCHIIKTTNQQRIPDDEPTILFRGRDYLALPMLKYYRQLCVNDGSTDFQLSSMDVMIQRFEQFATDHPQIMKQPGITRGK